MDATRKVNGHVAAHRKYAERLFPGRIRGTGISAPEFTVARIHERAVSHARNEPTSSNFRPTSADRNFKRRAVSTARRRLSDHRLVVPLPPEDRVVGVDQKGSINTEQLRER